MGNRKLVLAVCGAAVLAMMLAPHAGAVGASKTYLTFSRPVFRHRGSLGHVHLEIANPDTTADVVR